MDKQKIDNNKDADNNKNNNNIFIKTDIFEIII